MWGLWLTLDVLNYNWVIKVEDDQLLFSDFYLWAKAAIHVAESRRLEKGRTVLAIMAEPTSAGYCEFLPQICERTPAELLQSGVGWCDVQRTLVSTASFVNGHMLVMSRATYERYLQVWQHEYMEQNYYETALGADVGPDEEMLIAATSRHIGLANVCVLCADSLVLPWIFTFASVFFHGVVPKVCLSGRFAVLSLSPPSPFLTRTLTY